MKKLLTILCIRLTGFKPARFAEWAVVLAAEYRHSNRRGLIISLLKASVGLGASKTRWRARNRACRRCPLFEGVQHKCRPFAGSKLGCGCYMPFKNLVVANACWGKLNGLQVGAD